MRCSYLALLAALAGCGDKSHEAKPAPTQTPVLADVKVLDGKGELQAELKQIRPCRATIGPVEMIVGGPPIQSTVGATTWTGADDTNGTTFVRGEERIARMYPINDPATVSVFDMHGVPQLRVNVTGETASVERGDGSQIRKLRQTKDVILSDSPELSISGTRDLVLAGILSAPELLPEIRMLAACERVLVNKP